MNKNYFIKSSWKPFDDLIYIKINEKDLQNYIDKEINLELQREA